MSCRAQKSSIFAIVARAPDGVPETDFCPAISGKAANETGPGTTPTKCKRPFGASVFRKPGQFKSALTVEMMKSNFPAAAPSSPSLFELTTKCAPILLASSAFAEDEVNAVTRNPTCSKTARPNAQARRCRSRRVCLSDLPQTAQSG